MAIVAVAAARAQETPAPDLAAGESKYNGSCVACHGASGASQIESNPILAGQHFEYTRKQLLAYQNGERKNAIMAGMVAPLAAADIDNIAAFLAAAKAVIAGALDIDLARDGRKSLSRRRRRARLARLRRLSRPGRRRGRAALSALVRAIRALHAANDARIQKRRARRRSDERRRRRTDRSRNRRAGRIHFGLGALIAAAWRRRRTRKPQTGENQK